MLCLNILKICMQDDLSKGKYAQQSTTWSCAPSSNCAAGNAVDRTSSTCMRTSFIGPTSPDKTVWWFVDLGDIYSIYSVRILFKDYGSVYETRQRGRFAGFSIYLSKPSNRTDEFLCYKDEPPGLPPLDFNTTCIGYSQYVMFYNERLDGVPYEGYQISTFTELCEVIVEGCSKAGVYGSSCNLTCPVNCKDQRCNIVNGTCFECLPGWMGTFCENKCPVGLYGDGCMFQCAGHCNENTSCNHVTGLCDSECAAGWMGHQCDIQCKNETYSPGCVHNCSGHCLGDVICNRETGHCHVGCSPGYTGYYCSRACSAGYFGHLCEKRCSSHCLDNIACHHTDGICPNGCADGYLEAGCNKTCDHGSFGENCSGVCSSKCIDVCRHTDGICTCSPGYMGFNCSKECMGFYGINCDHICSKHCVNYTCDNVNGNCLVGCTESFRGEKCDQGGDSNNSWMIGLGISVTMNIITMIAITVFVILLRQGYLTLKTRSKHLIQSHTRERTSTTTDTKMKGDMSTYLELKISGSKEAYQELRVMESRSEYQNLSFT